jgi:hypothetical protein
MSTSNRIAAFTSWTIILFKDVTGRRDRFSQADTRIIVGTDSVIMFTGWAFATGRFMCTI